jgi:hypothetical protein
MDRDVRDFLTALLIRALFISAIGFSLGWLLIG